MSASSLIERFMPKIEFGIDGCWTWTAATNRKGYGWFRSDKRLEQAHRWSYEYHVGPIPEGLQLDHLCRNRACVNPDHLEPVTPGENSRRGEPASRTHCPRGHGYAPENTRRPNGHRSCVACNRDRNRERMRVVRNRGAA